MAAEEVTPEDRNNHPAGPNVEKENALILMPQGIVKTAMRRNRQKGYARGIDAMG